MPRFRIQSNLHLDGFQMLDACLENVTSFEGLDDRNTGRIVFLNGSSSNKSNLHPAVFYGNEFKGLAYLDDIEAITNGEGSLGTRVKALEDMLGLQDVTDVIDTWNDVKEFFANVDEGLDLMTMLDGKLDRTGGVMELDTIRSLEIKRKGSMSTIYFSNTNGALGFIGFNASAQPIIADATGGVSNIILHAGNFESLIGDTYLKTDGSNILTKNAYIAWNSNVDSNDIADWSTVNGIGLRIISSTSENSGAPTQYATALHVKGRYGFKIASQGGSYDALFFRNADHDWKTIAFTDSDITGNAATATKLKTAVSLWGNTFDGTQDISGVLYFNGINAIEGGENTLSIGWGFREKMTDIYGGTIRFKTKNAIAMTITEEGRVEIAGANNAYTRKLAVGAGGAHIIATTTGLPALGTPSSYSLLVGSVHYGLQIGTDTNDEASFIQAQRFNSVDAKALNLNPLGGTVNVGSVNAHDLFTTYGGIKLAGGTDYQKIRSEGTIVIGADSGRIDLSAPTEIDFITSASNMLFNGTSFGPWTQHNNAISLGRSEARWSNVYSVGGNFSGRVLIGGAEDDENYKLITNGAVKIGRSNIPNTYLGITITDTLATFDGVDTGDGFMHYSFRSHNNELLYLSGRNNGTSVFRTIVEFDKRATFNGGALIPTGQKLTIGNATIEYDSIAKAIKVDGNLFTTGTNASGGKADAQQGGTGGSAEVHEYEFLAGQSTYTELNPKGSRNVIVQIYEWNANDNTWDMILTDVSVTDENIIVTFGRDTTVNHLMTVV